MHTQSEYINLDNDLVKRETDLVKRETDLVNQETDTVKWIFMYNKYAVLTRVVTQTHS